MTLSQKRQAGAYEFQVTPEMVEAFGLGAAPDAWEGLGRAIRRKLILEIAGRRPRESPDISQVAAIEVARASPPCDIGEQLMRELFEDF